MSHILINNDVEPIRLFILSMCRKKFEQCERNVHFMQQKFL